MRDMPISWKPLVSVIIPNHNYSRYLKDSIQSVLNQTYRNFELIVVDDGSTDDSINTVMSFGKRVKLIAQAQAGVSAARNKGILAAKGELICFLDSDDAWLPRKLELQILKMYDTSADLVYSSIYNCNNQLQAVNEQAAVHKGSCHKEYLRRPTSAVVLLGCSNAIVKKELIDKVGGFSTTLNTSADWDFFRRISKSAQIDFESSPQILYRRHSGSMSASNLRTYYSDNEKAINIVVNEFRLLNSSKDRLVLSSQLLARFYFGSSKAMLKCGDILGTLLQCLKLMKSFYNLIANRNF